VTYREPDAERSEAAAREREVAAWLETMEATRAQRSSAPARSWLLWVLVTTGPFVGAGVASAVAAVAGLHDRSLVLLVGGVTGFLAGIALALRLALIRKDGLKP
jgi:hypothetical protein